MPVETAFGDSETARKRLDRNRSDTFLGHQFECGEFPVLGRKALLFLTLRGWLDAVHRVGHQFVERM